MGSKCFKSKSSKEVPNPYPKFTYVTTEAYLSIKFISKSNMVPKKLPFNPAEKRLPLDPLICKIAPDYFFITGGIDMFNWQRILSSFELRFEIRQNIESITPKEPCLYAPYGGTLYMHESQIYLVGSAENTISTEAEYDPDKIVEPFRPAGPQTLRNHKSLRPGKILRYSIPRNAWSELDLKPEMLEEVDGVKPSRSPDSILLPGTCKVENKIFFIGGILEGEERQDRVYTLDLETRKVQELSVKLRFEFGIFSELKCSRVSNNTIYVLGGFDKEHEYNKRIFCFKVKIGWEEFNGGWNQGCTEQIDEEKRFCDHYPPSGKGHYAIFYGYPKVLLINHKTKKKEIIDISVELK